MSKTGLFQKHTPPRKKHQKPTLAFPHQPWMIVKLCSGRLHTASEHCRLVESLWETRINRLRWRPDDTFTDFPSFSLCHLLSQLHHLFPRASFLLFSSCYLLWQIQPFLPSHISDLRSQILDLRSQIPDPWSIPDLRSQISDLRSQIPDPWSISDLRSQISDPRS